MITVTVCSHKLRPTLQLHCCHSVISRSLSSVEDFQIPPTLDWAFHSIGICVYVFSRGLILSICRWFYQMIMKTFFQVYQHLESVQRKRPDALSSAPSFNPLISCNMQKTHTCATGVTNHTVTQVIANAMSITR
ncbi:hypothetical protein EZV62_009636 [Acer yangbiense]|uniref:Uncharacterized protein n=1 Tax=Acer yangbiense TaxID=1000413 RepID=A0A5C7I2J8_9ROSI|nr:hypothetical protein EZV62_009636 [Acer yangbiense]